MKAVAYLRVSTEDQSLERQYDDIKKFAQTKSLDLVKIFEDKISGSKTNSFDRNGFNKMEKFIGSHGDIKHILVLEVSRLGRKNVDILNVIEKYIEKGINIHIKDLGQCTLDESGRKSFQSQMLITMLGVMAENEARLLSERIKSGKMSRARKNKAFGGKIIGYKRGEDGTPEIDETQAPMIRRIFELACQDIGMRKISTVIESEFDKKIAMGTLNGILKNTFHKGERKYNDLILEVPAIVTKEVWQKANDSIGSRTKFKSRTKVHVNIVQGKIHCGKCGNTMHQKVIPKGRIDLFICKDEKECKNSINRSWLFRMIKLAVEKHAQKTKDEQVREDYKFKILANKSVIEANNKELEKLHKRKIKAREVYLDDDEFSKEDFKEITSNADNKINSLTTHNNRLNEEITLYERSLENPIEHFSEDLELLKNEIKDIVKQITIYEDRVLIEILGWRSYDLKKPSSAKLGWMERKRRKGIPIKEELPLRHPIKEEQIEMMKVDYLNDKE